MKLKTMFECISAQLLSHPSAVQRAMFGCQAFYLHGRLMLVLASRNQYPWLGVLVPTEKKYHQVLQRKYSYLIQHPVLKKWLFLSESTEDFETEAATLVNAVLANERQIGVHK